MKIDLVLMAAIFDKCKLGVMKGFDAEMVVINVFMFPENMIPISNSYKFQVMRL